MKIILFVNRNQLEHTFNLCNLQHICVRKVWLIKHSVLGGSKVSIARAPRNGKGHEGGEAIAAHTEYREQKTCREHWEESCQKKEG